MTRALILRNLRHHGRLLAAMLAGLAGFEILIVRAAGLIEAGPGLRALLAMLPQPVQELIGTQLAFVSFPGAVAFGYQHPFVLAISIGFVIAAATVPASERESGLTDLLLARPVPRGRYLLASLALVVLASILAPLALLSGTAAGLWFVDGPGELPWTRYAAPAAGLATLLLAVGAFALLVAAGARRRGAAVAQIIGVVLALYVVEFLADLLTWLRWIRWASPFRWFKPLASAVVPSTPVENPLVLLGVFATATCLAFVRFGRRDL